MTYNYFCETCGETWEEGHPMAKRDDPVGDPCPHCETGKKKRGISAPAISHISPVGNIRKAGSGWNDLLGKIHKGAGKNSKINHN
jgi:putative FmdB family regulatory protein